MKNIKAVVNIIFAFFTKIILYFFFSKLFTQFKEIKKDINF